MLKSCRRKSGTARSLAWMPIEPTITSAKSNPWRRASWIYARNTSRARADLEPDLRESFDISDQKIIIPNCYVVLYRSHEGSAVHHGWSALRSAGDPFFAHATAESGRADPHQKFDDGEAFGSQFSIKRFV